MAAARLLILGVALVTLGAVLHLVGMATPHWTELKVMVNSTNSTNTSTISMDHGLFEVCTDGDCSRHEDESDALKAVQAMAFLGLISAIIGIVAGAVFITSAFCGRNPKNFFRLASGVFCIFGFVFMVVCIVTYAGKIFEDFRDEPHSRDTMLGYSFGLSSGGGVLMFVAGLLILSSKGFEVEQYTNIS